MGCGMSFLTYLKNSRILPKERCRILDFGTSCVVGATQENTRDFLEYFLGDKVSQVDQGAIDRFVASSVIQTGIRTAYMYEILDLIPQVEYLAFDVAPNANTKPFDLNGQFLERQMRGYYDVVLNFGTTEHVVNQFHCFKTIHDLLAPGGIAFNQVPSIGYSDHGYFAYEPKFFEHLAQANGYDILDMWLTPTGGSDFPSVQIREYGKESEAPSIMPNEEAGRASWSLQDPHTWSGKPKLLPWYVLNVAYRKKRTAPFRLGLDTQLDQQDLDQSVVGGRY